MPLLPRRSRSVTWLVAALHVRYKTGSLIGEIPLASFVQSVTYSANLQYLCARSEDSPAGRAATYRPMPHVQVHTVISDTPVRA